MKDYYWLLLKNKKLYLFISLFILSIKMFLNYRKYEIETHIHTKVLFDCIQNICSLQWLWLQKNNSYIRFFLHYFQTFCFKKSQKLEFIIRKISVTQNIPSMIFFYFQKWNILTLSLCTGSPCWVIYLHDLFRRFT